MKMSSTQITASRATECCYVWQKSVTCSVEWLQNWKSSHHHDRAVYHPRWHRSAAKTSGVSSAVFDKLNGFNNRTKYYCPYTSCLTADIFRLFEHRTDVLYYVSSSSLDNDFFMIADALAPNIIVKEEPWHTNKPHVRISIAEIELKLPGVV